MSIPLGRRLAAEALGSFFLFATVVGSGIMAESLSGGSVGLALLANTVATGAILFVLITILGPVSGAHMNPAVSLVAALRRELSAADAAAYTLVQVIGGVAGVIAAHLMFGQDAVQIGLKTRTGAGQWLAEGIATFGLIVTILGAVKHKPEAVPSAVALYIVAAYWFTASTSFANPAITIGRALTTSFSGIAPADAPGFILAQLAGAVLATAVAARLFPRYP